jgi:hypothetical protein
MNCGVHQQDGLHHLINDAFGGIAESSAPTNLERC